VNESGEGGGGEGGGSDRGINKTNERGLLEN